MKKIKPRIAGSTLLLITKVITILSLGLSISSATHAQSGRTRTVCIGENRSSCPSTPDVFKGCGTDIHTVAREICTTYTQGGPVVDAYHLDQISVTHGNKCGYHVFKVECD